MTQRADPIPVASCYDEMPFSRVLFRYLWPFWLFKDATRGDRMTRAAAYRHNRSMRMYLPGYMLKWVFSSALAFLVVQASGNVSSHTPSLDMFALLAVISAIAFVCSLCVLLLTGYIYLYLDKHES